jgi:HSP20 family protein
MNYLTRWDPSREMISLHTMMDRFFNGDQSVSNTPWVPQTWSLALDVVESDDEYVVKASLPGINLEDLDITYDSNVLTIKGETKREEESEDECYHMRERRYGVFSRSIALPSTIKADKIDANYEAGVLTLRLPKSEEAKPKRITVRTTGKPKVLEGRASSISKN